MAGNDIIENNTAMARMLCLRKWLRYGRGSMPASLPDGVYDVKIGMGKMKKFFSERNIRQFFPILWLAE